MTGRFAGFPAEGIRFFKGLARHNDREWFRKHREIYERACREPMQALLVELGARPASSKISRINRDVRFARDRAPYRTHIAAGTGRYYVTLSADGLYVGAGIYMPEPVALRRLRDAIAQDSSGRSLEEVVAALRRKRYVVDTHERVASVPKGYGADHPRIDLLRMKDIFGGRMLAPGPWLSTRRALARVRKAMTDLEPLADWLDRHVGSRQA